MRKIFYLVVLVMVVITLGSELNGQEPAPFVAVRDCQINPGERAAFREAQRALLDYVIANPIEAPGSIAGTFRGALNNFNLSRLVWHGQNLGEWDEWNRLSRQARRADPQRQAVYRERNSHLNSCKWEFVRRIVN